MLDKFRPSPWRRVLAALAAAMAAGGAAAAAPRDFAHIVVIYQENHSFDNLFGLWGKVGGRAVDGLDSAPRQRTLQARQDGTPYRCLLQNDVNLASPPLAAECLDGAGAAGFGSHFRNAPFRIDDFIGPAATTCPDAGLAPPDGIARGSGAPGGCTRDLVHRFYQEQYQIHGGRQDRYVTGSDAAGLAMGYYDTKRLPIHAYLHASGAPAYVIAERFFQAAFGGSFLNHQWLIAAHTPVFEGAANDGGGSDLHTLVDANGMPANTPLYASPLGRAVADAPLAASCTPPADRPATPPGAVCGDYAVNTIQPAYPPYAPGTPEARRLPPQTAATIGEALSLAGIDWAWYSGGWSNAAGNVDAPGWSNGAGGAAGCTDPNRHATAAWPYCPDRSFQFHHQPFNYFAAYAPGTAARAAHLRDETEFIAAAREGRLKTVSFVKPLGMDNEHPGYASEQRGNAHLVELLRAIDAGPQAGRTLVIVAYDEFGGAWDHVPPPGQGGTPGPHDEFGPGSRIPVLLISRRFKRSAVDHESHDTTAILATIEHRFHLPALSRRDAAVKDLWGAVQAATR